MLNKKKIGAIIFSRYDSNRLFGKALIEIEGRPLLGRVIDRTKLIKGIDQIVVATSKRKIDDEICEFAESEGIEIYRGSCNDVYKRSIEACEKFNFNFFARICGDRPFIDFDLITNSIKIFKKENYDLITTLFPRTYPPGLTIEIINSDLLKRYDKKISNSYDREHLTTFFYKHPDNIKIQNLSNNFYDRIKGIKLVVDTKEDLKRARWIAKNEDKNQKIQSIESIISLALRYEEKNKL